jgi:hypothetical protein
LAPPLPMEKLMKLRLVSRLMVVTLVVVVGLIIILHQRSVAGNPPSVPTATPTPTTVAGWPGELPVSLSW